MKFIHLVCYHTAALISSAVEKAASISSVAQKAKKNIIWRKCMSYINVSALQKGELSLLIISMNNDKLILQ